MLRLRQTIQAQVREMFAPDASLRQEVLEREAAREDTGFFGPDSIAWRVHGDLTTMMIGGVAALLLQMLHPGAMAGVWDHSNFREDRLGRLRRTARFMAGTTYGSKREAQEFIRRVRTIHDRVAGTLPDGRSYSANDPEILTWVHVAGTVNFLAAYVRYRDPLMSRADQDRYFAEWALTARELGAVEIPETRAAAEAYLRRMRPKLKVDARVIEAARVLLSDEDLSSTTAPAIRLLSVAAKDLLPGWASAMHGFRIGALERPVARVGAHGMAQVLRWALTESAETRARKRAAEITSDV